VGVHLAPKGLDVEGFHSTLLYRGEFAAVARASLLRKAASPSVMAFRAMGFDYRSSDVLRYNK
jgi:hypothetical protein